MLKKAADHLKRVVFPLSDVLNRVGMGVAMLAVLLTLAEIFARRVLDSPIKGELEITKLALLLIMFFTLAHCAARDAHVEMDVITVRFPKRLKAGVSTVINAMTIGILGISGWQLWLLAIRVQTPMQTLGTIDVAIYPFIYIAALCIMLLALVYFIRFLYSLHEVCQ